MPPTRKLLSATLLATVLLAGCGDDDDAATTATTTAADAGDGSSGGGAASGVEGISVAGEFGESAEITLDGAAAPTELVTEDLVVGDGDEVPDGATVTVQYVGVLLDGTKFDSSFDRGEPITFPLSGVIPGWTQGIPGMHVGGRRLLVIPSDLAYGPAGYPPVIGPDEPLVFVVDMISFQ